MHLQRENYTQKHTNKAHIMDFNAPFQQLLLIHRH